MLGVNRSSSTCFLTVSHVSPSISATSCTVGARNLSFTSDKYASVISAWLISQSFLFCFVCVDFARGIRF